MDQTFIIKREKDGHTFYATGWQGIGWSRDVALALAFSAQEADSFCRAFNTPDRIQRHGKAVARASADVLMGTPEPETLPFTTWELEVLIMGLKQLKTGRFNALAKQQILDLQNRLIQAQAQKINDIKL